MTPFELMMLRQLVPGNINLFGQPVVKNPDGSHSTVDSIGVGMDGREVLLPRVTPDGRHLSREEAIEEYQRTGRHLGMFADIPGANQYAQRLHEDYAAGRYRTPLATSRSTPSRDAISQAIELLSRQF